MCLIWALGAPAGHANEPGGLGVYVELTMVPRTHATPPSDAPGTRPGRGMPGFASNCSFNVVYNAAEIGSSSEFGRRLVLASAAAVAGSVISGTRAVSCT